MYVFELPAGPETNMILVCSSNTMSKNRRCLGVSLKFLLLKEIDFSKSGVSENAFSFSTNFFRDIRYYRAGA